MFLLCTTVLYCVDVHVSHLNKDYLLTYYVFICYCCCYSLNVLLHILFHLRHSSDLCFSEVGFTLAAKSLRMTSQQS